MPTTSTPPPTATVANTTLIPAVTPTGTEVPPYWMVSYEGFPAGYIEVADGIWTAIGHSDVVLGRFSGRALARNAVVNHHLSQ